MNTTDQPNVVVATDGSALGDSAVRWALEYARARRLPLRLAVGSSSGVRFGVVGRSR